MAHEISLVANMNFVLHKDVLFVAKRVAKGTQRSKLGTLMVSKGNVEWRPKGNSVTAYRLGWAKLGEIMEEYGKKVRKQKRKAKAKTK